ncbi:MAG: haloalkane dehalogenase [Pseudomonadota bacterium]
MTAYFVVCIEVHDRERFNDYTKAIVATMKPFGGWILAAGPAERLEGDEPAQNHNVIIQFPTTAQCKAWWESAAYRDIVAIRLESSSGAAPYVQPALSGDFPDVSGAERYGKKVAEIHGRRMSYVDEGEGDPIVFLHGNPTSSYLWRNVIPYLVPQGRCIAPDLIGMGDSEKLPDSNADAYRFVEHRKYLDALLEHLGVTRNVTLVIHDWGSVLGFDWANRHRDAVQGVAYMEAIVRPMSWEEWPQPSVRPFQMMRSDAGEQKVLGENFFVDRILPASVLRPLGEAEMNAYRRPFLTPGEDRRPTLTWPRQLPIGGEPADVVEIVQSYADWLPGSAVPKLFIDAEPGSVLVGPMRDFARTFSNQQEVTVRGLHFIQEDSPDAIGQAIATWREGL